MYMIPVISKECVFKSFVQVFREKLKLPNTDFYDYYTVETRPESVMTIILNGKNEILITKEWRPAVSDFVLSFPGGFLDDNENPETCALREALEETGWICSVKRYLGSCYPLPGLLRQKMHIFLLEAKEYRKPMLEPTESIQTSWISMEEFKEYLLRNESLDGVMLSAVSLMLLDKSFDMPWSPEQ